MENSVVLHTRRLRLVPLSLEQMQMQRDHFAKLEQSLGLAPSGRVLDHDLRPIVSRAIVYMEREAEDAIWNTMWMAIDTGLGCIVGSLGFKGPANDAGEVEIGYGFDPPFQNQGYATEAVGALVAWALAQPGIQAVTAETDYTNIPSIRVLQKIGFIPTHSRNHFLYWRVDRQRLAAARGDVPEQTQTETFELYDLAVVVERIDGHCTCNMRVGDAFFLRNSSSLSLPEGGHFCVYALQAVLPLLPAKQRQNHPADWMETDTRAVCPDPACKLVMRIDRVARRTLHHDDVSPIPLGGA